MSWFWKPKPRPVWTFVATVRGRTEWTPASDEGSSGTGWCYWALEEKGAERRSTFYATGQNAYYMRNDTAFMSPASAEVKIAVDVWLKGGPLPKSTRDRDDNWPPKKPPEPEEPDPPAPPTTGDAKRFIDEVLSGKPEPEAVGAGDAIPEEGGAS